MQGACTGSHVPVQPVPHLSPRPLCSPWVTIEPTATATTLLRFYTALPPPARAQPPKTAPNRDLRREDERGGWSALRATAGRERLPRPRHWSGRCLACAGWAWGGGRGRTAARVPADFVRASAAAKREPAPKAAKPPRFSPKARRSRGAAAAAGQHAAARA
eukprot:scaffold17108_cov139-Isochrysis_galbana.AAC.2